VNIPGMVLSMRTWSVCSALTLMSVSVAFGYQRNESSRLSIKHATDAAAANIPTKAVHTTVEEMLSLSRPEGLAADISSQAYQTTRIEKFETTRWVLEATITEIVKRADGDFYMVIEGKSGAKTVVEAPDPELCAGSHFLGEIKKVRKMLDDKFHPTAQPIKVNIKAQFTGVGFFGYQGRTPSGGRTNGARLMPALDLKISD